MRETIEEGNVSEGEMGFEEQEILRAEPAVLKKERTFKRPGKGLRRNKGEEWTMASQEAE